jgi:hypothetical protein
MRASAHALLNQVIDYAGLFPPAKLSLEEALRKYFQYRKASPHRWMLGRFICPTVRLPDLLALAKNHADASLLFITVLGQQGADPNDFLTTLEADIGAIKAFRDAWGTDSVIDTIEVPLPKEGNADRLAYYSGIAMEQMPRANLRGFLEIPVTPTWQNDVKKIAHGLHVFHQLRDEPPPGLKFRCGGVSADAFPSESQVAFFIAQCRTAHIPWKATAGLHHPRRHWDPSLQLWHHGFLNVFGAAVLAWNNALTEADLVEILSDRDAQHFRFEEGRFAWKTWACTAAQVAEARSDFATTLGSCSFEEPCADLVAMGLLDERWA